MRITKRNALSLQLLEVLKVEGKPGKCTAGTQAAEKSGFDSTKLDEILPKAFKHHIVEYEELGDPDHFKVEMRVNIFSKDEALQWLREFEEITGSNFRTRKTFKENSNKLVFKKLYRCHKNTHRPKMMIPKRPNLRDVGCGARLNITVKNNKMKWSSDVLLEDFPCIIVLTHDHCHSLTTPDTLRYRRPLPELKSKFASLFAAKLSPSTALKIHKLDLQREYGDKYAEVVLDAAKCPPLQWVYKLYYTIYQRGVRVAEGKRKNARKTSSLKIKKEKDSICKEEIILAHPPEVYIAEQGVCDQLIRDVDISIISETRQLEIGNCDMNSDSFFLQSDEVHRGVESMQQFGSNQFILIDTSQAAMENDHSSQDETSLSLPEDDVRVELVESRQIDRKQKQLNVHVEHIEQFGVDLENADEELQQDEEHLYCETNILSESTLENSESTENRAQQCVGRVEQIFCDLKMKIDSNPELFVPCVEKFVSMYEELATSEQPESLLAALKNFGSNSSLLAALQSLTKTCEHGEEKGKSYDSQTSASDEIADSSLPSRGRKRKIIFLKLSQPPSKKVP